MKFVSDSSFLTRLYLGNSDAEIIHEYLAEDEKVVCLSELAKIEVLNVLLRKESSAVRFLSDVEEGLRFRVEPVDWPRVFKQAESLAHRFSASMRPGGHDLVLVAGAVVMGATWFLSFDSNSRQRPLAAISGLRVWPPLDKNEKGLVKHFSSGKGI